MNSIKEGFELLDSLGISREVQHLVSAGLREDASGKLIADYRDEKGRVVDQEILAVSMQKMSSCGILHFSPALPENVRTLYISDAIMHLIFMVQRKIHRIDFSYAAFLVSGARMDRKLIEKRMDQYPEGVKIYTLFGHSLIGRIRDCKVQHWVKGLDGSFRVAGNKVVILFKGKEFWIEVGEFSLRNHCRQVGLRQTISACKPIDKNIDNFYLFS
ncbi:hypothetical protein SAMN04488057_11281 [Cyclobacterium lianum]|uniref:Uncharacterized protein n=1 Tax=Cyclobacterium lianum TaxID=388280 RepID=A0A1M7PZM1_9BACT|nr:hypothetical protein [Cyclobacterium lianum]SHN23250.1 hypothetical protein SAMN04488057_11281 [Cyclobacterium lianum]